MISGGGGGGLSLAKLPPSPNYVYFYLLLARPLARCLSACNKTRVSRKLIFAFAKITGLAAPSFYVCCSQGLH